MGIESIGYGQTIDRRNLVTFDVILVLLLDVKILYFISADLVLHPRYCNAFSDWLFSVKL